MTTSSEVGNLPICGSKLRSRRRFIDGTRYSQITDHSKVGMRKVAAQEINSIEGLRKLYANVTLRLVAHTCYILTFCTA